MSFHIDDPVAAGVPLARDHDIRIIREQCVKTARKSGQCCFFALIGIRKIGKRSIIHEIERHYENVPDLYVVVMDCYQWRDDGDGSFRYRAVSIMELLGLCGFCQYLDNAAVNVTRPIP